MGHYDERMRKLHGSATGCGPDCGHTHH
jgi:hypothetical protein